jgi:MSHA biogenesis protein MshM
MYLEHFGLSEAPFRITPHTDFFFGGANRGATLDALIYAITHDEGIVKVSGEVGSGKTMLCRVLMERLPDKVTTIYLANPSLSRDDILYAIADELNLPIAENARTATVLRSLHTHLIDSFSEGRQVVVLIDEAHAMPVETLEEIRLLSNLESNKHKLLQLVMFGQPELNAVLSRPDMRQLKERITHNFVLEPLIHTDISGYIDFRMRAAGYKGPNLFGAEAIKGISKASLGLTRRVNIIADKALLAAFALGRHEIGPGEVATAINDCDFGDSSFAVPRFDRRFVTGLLIVVALAIGIMVGSFFFGSTNRDSDTTISRNSGSVTEQTERLSAPLSSASVSADSTAVQGGSTPAAVITGSPAGNASTAQPSKQATSNNTIELVTAPIDKDRETSALGASGKPVATASAPSALKSYGASTSIVAEPIAVEPPLGKLTQASVAAGKRWLRDANDEHWFIQLLATDETRIDAVESYLARAQSAGQLDQIRAYIAKIEAGGSVALRVGVIYGDFETREAALNALKSLPKTLTTGKPYPRRVVRLR